MRDRELLALSCSIEMPIGPGRRFLRVTCVTAVALWTCIAALVPPMAPFAASAWVGWWLLYRMRVA